MKRRSSVFSANRALFLLLAFTASLWAQSGYNFGQNKVRYKKFDWKVYRTEHFDVHYYDELETTAHDAARMAERGYAYLSDVLDYQIKDRVPLILYASLNDFSQTNVINGLLNQGTRGVTEGLKKRVTLPVTGSYREFNHVLVHELVHAFQFDMLFADKIPNNRFNPPLWFMEGMAEYLSSGMDNTTRMWVRDGVLHDDLMTVQQLNGTLDIRVYRIGQSLWHYIGENHGKKVVGDIFKTAIRSGSMEKAIKTHLSMDLKQLTEAWHAYAASISVPADTTLATPGDVAEQVTHRKTYFDRMNIAPAVSPNGKNIAYVGNKNLNEEIYLLSEQADGSYTDQHLVSGGKSRQFETLRFFDTSMGWSRDGKRLAFISRSGKDDVIYIIEARTGNLLSTYRFDQLNGLLSPTFSPEGGRLVFVGIRGGVSDLYVLNLQNEELRRLTNDKYATLHPQWGVDERIAFITDRAQRESQKNLLFSDFDVAVYDLVDNTTTLVTDLPGSATNPQWSPDGSKIAFISDHEGIPNIYKVDLDDHHLTRLTALKTGVSGITETTPAFSWSANGEVMIFSAFVKSSWQLFKLDMDKLDNAAMVPVPLALADNRGSMAISPIVNTPGDSTDAIAAIDSMRIGNVGTAAEKMAGWLPALADINTIYEDYPLSPADSVAERDYKGRFKLDAIAVGGGYNSFFGVQGGASFLFSDMLGNHNLFLSSELQFSDPRYSDASLTYFNQARRLSWGIQGYQSSLSYLTGATFNQLGLIRNTYRGFNGLIAYPFSKFARVELNAGLTWIDQDGVLETFSLGRLERDDFNINTYNYGQIGAALVFDNTTYGFLGPTSGSRSRFSIETTTNDIQSTTAFVDYRRYFRTTPRTVLAWRFLGAASLGQDERFFDAGGPYAYRGVDYNELVGANFMVSNLEFRFPMLPFLPPTADLLSGAAFFDTGGAWGNSSFSSNENFQPFTTEGGFRLSDLNAAAGVSARFNIGYFLLQYDVAWPTNLKDFRDPVTRFSIGTFF